MSQATNIDWYILYTALRREDDVRNLLESLGIECWLPLYRTPRIWHDQTKMVEIPLFPSLVFVRCSEAELGDLSAKITDIARIMFYKGKPVVLREAKVDAVHELFGQISGDKLL